MSQMAPAMRFIAYLSPLTYAQDLMNHAVIGEGLLNPWIDMTVLLGSAILFLIPSIKMHHRAKIKGV
jgi:ABC-type multidrug transport system permease subunit